MAGEPLVVEATEQTATRAVKNIIASIEKKEKAKFKSSYLRVSGYFCSFSNGWLGYLMVYFW